MRSRGENRPALHGFERRFFDSEQAITRIGRGEPGGKARGLILACDEIVARTEPALSSKMNVFIPKLTVLTTDMFESFVEHNQLRRLLDSDLPDDRIAHAFQKGSIPPEWVGDLRALAAEVHTPLAIRSSSLLEDHLDHPMAGMYATKMIPNNQHDTDARFRKLVEAVKFVWASTWSTDARETLHATGKSPVDESMAVVVQEIVGRRIGDRFYPAVSGVARSYNYYPPPGSESADGVVNLALGLGKTIVDGDLNWTYCPSRPKAPPPFASIRDMLEATQTNFWAVDMGKPPLPDPIRETEYLARCTLAESERDGVLPHLVSTFDSGADRMYSGLSPRGPRALNFAPLLSGHVGPFNETIRHLLQLSKETLGADVEVEFAMDLDPSGACAPRIGFLQMRPMRVDSGTIELSDADLEDESLVLQSHSVMGNGRVGPIHDVVFIDPDEFEPRATREMAIEIAEANRSLVEQGRQYILIGFGRWGSSDPWLGIPVKYGQITGARAIVESTLPGMNPDPSQGAHFFHNMIGFGVLYLNLGRGDAGSIDWDALRAMPVIHKKQWVTHARSETPLSVVVDGRTKRGLVKRDD